MNILETILNADMGTKIFILCSNLLLIFIQYKLFKWHLYLKYQKFKTFIWFLIHGLFGVFLNYLSSYSIVVHLVAYIVPSVTIAWLAYLISKISFKPKEEVFKFVFKAVSGNHVVITNIFRHIALIGGAGSGKTRSIIKWVVKQMAEYNFCGMVHDFKKWDLAKTVYTHYLNSDVDNKWLNFFSLPHSHQFNAVSLRAIPEPAYANEIAHTFVVNLSKMSKNSDPYFVEAAESLLAAVIWKFREDLPEKCTFPYIATYIMLASTEQVNDFINTNIQAEILAAPYRKIKGSEKGAGSVESTLANALRKIGLPQIYWILSGDDIHPQLNNPEHKTMLCISNNMKLDSTYGPIIAMIMDVCGKAMSEPNMAPSGSIVEEGSVIYLPSLAKMAATLREYKSFVLFCLQDITQGEILYDRLGITSLLANLGTHIYGRVMDISTAEKYSKMLGKFYKKFTSRTRTSTSIGNKSYTVSDRQVYNKEPDEFMHFAPGHFVGLVAEGNVKKFEETFVMYQEEEYDLPEINKVTPEEVKANFVKIVTDVKMMLPAEKTSA